MLSRVVSFLLIFPIFQLCSCSSLKIINGKLAKSGQFPHMVQLSISQKNSTNKFCGGSLINQQWILTAAHCVKHVTSIKAYLGTVHMRKVTKKMNIVEIIVHPSYKNDSNYDIALLKMQNAIEFDELVQPALLPEESKEEPDPNEILQVAGFGDTKSMTQSNMYLRYINMKLVTNEDCSKEWYWKIRENLLCAQGLNGASETTCNGDSGSGLISKKESSTIIYGIVSYGSIGCIGRPKVFTRVTSHLNFIKSNIH